MEILMRVWIRVRCVHFYFVIISLFIFSISSAVQAEKNPFIQTFLLYQGNPVKQDQIEEISNFNILEIQRYKYDDLKGGVWNSLKKINPEIEIYIYQMGSEISDNQDSDPLVGLFTVGRYNKSRGHSMGALNTQNPGFFLTNSLDERIRHPQYSTCWLLDFGSPDFLAYWIEATRHDIVNQPWKADGIFVDNCSPAHNLGNMYGVMPKKYPVSKDWNDNMHFFINGVVQALHSNKQKVIVNRGNSRRLEGFEAWINLDRSAYPPDIVMEEGAFAVRYGDSDVRFYSEEDWKRQADIAGQIENSKIILMSHCDLREGETGRDNNGKPVSFRQVLWYSMCSYHLARRDNPNNCYFSFVSPSDKDSYVVPWFDEFGSINLGRAFGSYKIQKVGRLNVYYREFEKGYIYVNPTNYDITPILLQQPSVLITHENFYSNYELLKKKTFISLQMHTGAIVMK